MKFSKAKSGGLAMKPWGSHGDFDAEVIFDVDLMADFRAGFHDLLIILEATWKITQSITCEHKSSKCFIFNMI